MFGQSAAGGMFGQNTGGGLFGQSAGGGLFGQSAGGGGLFGQSTGGGLFGQSAGGGGLFGQNTGGGLFGQNTGGGLFGQNTGGGLFGQKPAGGLFGANTGGGMFGQSAGGGGLFGQNTGGGLFGQNTGGGLFGQNTGGGLFGQNTGGGLFGQNTGGGLFGQNTGGGMFGQNTGGGLFGQKPAGGGLFGANTGGGLFGANAGGGGLFGANTGGGLFGANTGGGLFGMNTGGGLFGQSSAGGMFGMQMQSAGGMFGQPGQAQAPGGVPNPDPYGLGSLVTTNHMPPRPVGLIFPRAPARSSAAYLWKAQPESISRLKPKAVPGLSRSTSEGSAADRSPRSAGTSFSLPPAANSDRPYGSVSPRTRPQNTLQSDVSPSSLLRMSAHRSPKQHQQHTPEVCPEDFSMPPLRRPNISPPVTPTLTPRGFGDESTKSSDRPLSEKQLNEKLRQSVQPIRPNFVTHGSDMCTGDDEFAPAAPPSLVPKFTRPEYYSSPSVEAMSKMSELKLSQVDNLEIGRYGYGSIRWPGLTDVRRLDFDTVMNIETGRLELYPERERPPVGEELNKEAVVTLHIRPSNPNAKLKSIDVLRSRLAKCSEDFGGQFISYDMEKWIFRVPNLEGIRPAN